MEQLPQKCIYRLQLSAEGGLRPLQDQQATTAEPVWLHLDYEQPESAGWLRKTELISEAAREALLGQSSRPKLVRQGDNLLLTLRGINHNQGNSPEEMVALRIYITPSLIISSRHRPLLSEQDVYEQLANTDEPVTLGDWLVEICDALTDRAGEFVEDLHDHILELEEQILMRELPTNSRLGRIRKQMILVRRYLSPQRDLIARLASEKIGWLNDDDRRRLLDIADRLRRWLDDLDAGLARTAVLTDEVNNLMTEATNHRAYQMSIMALMFLPASFLTGLFGINLGGMPGADSPAAFWIFCISLLALGGGLGFWLHRNRWW
ncbi:zinc transporter ZntB [Oceanimonas smirnovii]|uniref:zinc transporter ZntB n=1 Tax=Oceanimonas smirnovii TaxID=264574 RepID=UPI00376FFB6C